MASLQSHDKRYRIKAQPGLVLLIGVFLVSCGHVRKGDSDIFAGYNQVFILDPQPDPFNIHSKLNADFEVKGFSVLDNSQLGRIDKDSGDNTLILSFTYTDGSDAVHVNASFRLLDYNTRHLLYEGKRSGTEFGKADEKVHELETILIDKELLVQYPGYSSSAKFARPTWTTGE